MKNDLVNLVTEYLSNGGRVKKALGTKKAKGIRYFNVTLRSKKIGKLNFHGQRY